MLASLTRPNFPRTSYRTKWKLLDIAGKVCPLKCPLYFFNLLLSRLKEALQSQIRPGTNDWDFMEHTKLQFIISRNHFAKDYQDVSRSKRGSSPLSSESLRKTPSLRHVRKRDEWYIDLLRVARNTEEKYTN